MAVLVPGSRQRTVLILAGVLAVAVGTVVWRMGRRLPVAETRRFLTAPVELGDAPPPPPAGAAGPAEVARRYDLARTAFADQRYAEAAIDFAWVVAQEPSGPRAGVAQWNVVRSRLRGGDGTGAMAALHDLLAHHAGYLGQEAPRLRDGLEQMGRGDLAAAQRSMEAMVHDQPDSEFVPLAHAMIARIHWSHGEPMEMVRSFARMLTSVRDVVPAYARLAHYLQRYADGDAQVADNFAEMARSGDEGFKDIYQYLAARTLLEQGRFEATRSALETLRHDHPDGDFTHIVDLEEAWNLLRNERAAEALAIFERLDRTPAPAGVEGFDEFFDLRAELPMGIARCYEALGRHAEAAAAFERAILRDPNGTYAVANGLGLAHAYEGQGQLDRAATQLRQVIDAHPDEPQSWALRQQLTRIEARIAAAGK